MDSTTCRGKLGRVMQVTLMARLSSWIARGSQSEEENRMNAKFLKNAWMEPTGNHREPKGDLISGSLHPVEQPALLLDLPQVRLVGVEQLLQITIDIASHIFIELHRVF